MTPSDAGYASGPNFTALEAQGLPTCVVLGREAKRARPIDPATHPATQCMAARMAPAPSKDHHRRGKFIAEPPFGWFKQALGFHPLRLGSLPAATGERTLVCLSPNRRRLFKLAWQPP